jgi:hypothetical protein
MASYSESLMPPPIDNRPVVEVPPADSTPILCALCGKHNCPQPGACR